jgi:hypothetical protein
MCEALNTFVGSWNRLRVIFGRSKTDHDANIHRNCLLAEYPESTCGHSAREERLELTSRCSAWVRYDLPKSEAIAQPVPHIKFRIPEWALLSGA